ncbi:sigma-70 family RNA polymerase sigma factor [Pseudanabaena sp. 'Roaring Creek']|uniref:sigma-70 family RNA polymerase sigma factor n=1 Tax=Pseudanabaena sp. 'Roaring Creek' TaxID=1681830 RepID=UPI0006D78DDD|nr:sigma-70 family RNA polymerase sigma factor [Pseudanabaena sp. 'Roaring Creek']
MHEPDLSQSQSPKAYLVKDTDLLRSLKDRQMSALEMLYQRYGGVVYGIALKALKTPQDAEDLVQEIFLALWNHPPNPEHSYFVRYLVTMTRTRVIDKSNDC